MFGKVGNNESINPTGIGLGLTICNKILDKYGSQLMVESEVGKGTTFSFTVTIPVCDIDVENPDDPVSVR